MNFMDIAPWLSIVITFVVAILVPFFTQLSTNRFQLKKMKIEEEKLKESEKVRVFTRFIENAGMISDYIPRDKMMEMLPAITGLYAFAPQEWWNDIDLLYQYAQDAQTAKATPILLNLCKLVSKELNKD